MQLHSGGGLAGMAWPLVCMWASPVVLSSKLAGLLTWQLRTPAGLRGWMWVLLVFFLFKFFLLFKKFFYFFGCVGSSLLRVAFLSLWRAGATLRCSVQASHCGGFSCCGARALGMRASVVVAHRLICSTACRIFLDQGSNLCPLHWQVDS